ncbi:conserved hypothetical protein [Ricinus communis]|uniref:Uncharacterized protein n=1 Tax=Ricinus communis TaxID=3988 RepID=B9T8Y7_RICCO|nr:conserved hypothetical protein [Ricinus communis]
MIDQPLRKALQQPETSSKLVHWSIQLSKHDIRYASRKVLKAQILADFITKVADMVEEKATNNVVEYEVMLTSLELTDEKGELLKDIQAFKIQRNAANYSWYEGILYRRSLTYP